MTDEEYTLGQVLPQYQDSIVITRPRRDIQMPIWFVDMIVSTKSKKCSEKINLVNIGSMQWMKKCSPFKRTRLRS